MDKQIAVQKGNCRFTGSLAFAFLQEKETQRKWLPTIALAAIQTPLFPAAIDFDGSNGPKVVQRIFLA
jgi:hypothetical protein